MGIKRDVTFHASWWHKHAGVNFNRVFFDDPVYRVERDINMRRLLHEKFGAYGLGEKVPKARPIVGSDLLASGYLFSQMLGCDVRFSEHAPPEVISPKLTDEQVEKLAVPDLTTDALWQQTMRQFAILEEKYGYAQSHINLQGVQNIALDLRGSELFIDYYDNPKIAQKLISVSLQLMLEVGKALAARSKVLSHGVTAITSQVMPDVYLTSNCTVEMVSEPVYEEFLLESDQRLADEFRPFGVHHCGQTMEHVVNGYARLKNLAFAEVGAGSDVAAVRKALPGVFLNLRYSPVKLKEATKDEIMTEIRKMADGAESLFSISCVGIDVETEDRRVMDFLDCVDSLD